MPSPTGAGGEFVAYASFEAPFIPAAKIIAHVL
jgi:hypothetical protein